MTDGLPLARTSVTRLFHLIPRLLRLIPRSHRRRWVELALLAVVVSALETVGAFLIYGLFELVTGTANEVTLPLIGNLAARFPHTSEQTLLELACTVVAAFFLLRGVLALLQLWLQFRVASEAGLGIAESLLVGYVDMPLEEHLQLNSSSLIRDVNESTETVARQALLPITLIGSDLLILLGVGVVLFMKAPLFSGISLITLGIAVMLMLRFIQPIATRAGAEAQAGLQMGLQRLTQIFEGIREVKLSGAKRAFEDAVIAERRRFLRASYSAVALGSVPRLAIETIFVILVVIALLLEHSSDPATRSHQFAVIGLLGYGVLRILPSVSRITLSLTGLRFSAAAIENVEVGLSRGVSHTRALELNQTGSLRLDRSLVLDHVVYRYRGARAAAVEIDDTLTVDAGSWVAITGPTGSGKTTFVNLIVGLLDPQAGKVLVDGQDIKDDRRGWQASVSMVPQGVFLTDDTLLHNVAFGIAENEIDRQLALDSLAMAQLSTLVDNLANGVDTPLGERGERLSGGQRQRIAIARALYRRPSLLVMDEGTSALDQKTEQEVVDAIEHIRRDGFGVTVVSIAHRLSTVRQCDNVLILKDGRIAEQGKYEDLETRDGYLKSLLVPGPLL